MRLALPDIVAATGGRLVVPPGVAVPEAVSGVATDSRRARPGDIFVALRGPRTDGHLYVADAAAQGAALAIVADASAAAGPALVVADTLRALGALAALHRRALPVTVVGITGSVGKTTTVGMCARMLEERYVTARSAESWNAEIGVAMTLLGLGPAHQIAVVEMAMRGLGQIRELVDMAQPRIGVVTNIGDAHLELLGSRDRIAQAKAELLEGLPADGDAIVNADDPFAPRLVRDVRCRVIRYGTGADADVRAARIRSSAGGCRFTLLVGTQDREVALPVVGAHQARNALAAAAVAYVLGLSLDEIARGLARAPVSKMRQELLTVDDILIVDDSYNASPQSMATAFEVLRQVGGRRRRVLVLGEMLELGPDAPAFHREAGDLAAALKPALLVVVGPNARWYLEGAGRAALPAETTAWAATADAAIPIVRESVKPGDVVLVKGSRGIAMEHVVAALRQDRVAGGP